MYNLITTTTPVSTDTVVVQSGTNTARKTTLSHLTKGLAVFVADTGVVAGCAGLVPASAVGDAEKGYIFSASGTFVNPLDVVDLTAYVTGTNTSTDGHLALFDGTTGKAIKGSGMATSSLSRVDATDTRSAGIDFQDNIAQRMLLKDSAEVNNSVSSSANAITLDYATGNVFTTTLTENIATITLSNPPASGNLGTIMWFITQDSTARTITWPASVLWDSHVPPNLMTVSSKHIITLMTINAGTTWFGFHSGKDMS